MKKTFVSLLLIVLLISTVFTSCDIDKILGAIDEETELPLEAPTNLRVDESNATLYWNSVEYAIGYTVKIDAATYTTETNSFSLQGLPSGEYTISVMANGDGIRWISSEYSDTIHYTRNADSGNKYEDDVIAAFREFDEINTKSSYLGYGIDIINADAINSKNVLMNYPIFDMKKLLDEQLLKSNEHYNSFQSIEAKTIEEFTINMGTSTSVSSGTSVSASGNIKGVDVSASASLTNGLTQTFTKTSEMVESQYFLEIISENQSYWLILQSSEQRYKELLSDEFKADLYSDMEPAQLFQKYGTHMLTSVAMGGSIHMYYTLYSYEKGDKTKYYNEVSTQLKTEVEAAYGGYSAGVGNETSFENSFTYETISKKHGIQIDECIYAAGGSSYGINSKYTLYDNYYDWQKSLDTNPVVIGIKDINSLYPIWDLLDMSVEGAEERYTELYEYFQTYGKGSYKNLLETFDITPPVDPTDITDIKVGVHEDYSENQVINVRPGERLQISYDVVPDNATKYIKTYSVENTELAKIDENGLLVISPDATSGSYVRVNITAGSVNKTITLYVVNAYNVNFNTRVANLEVSPIYGILEGYTIDEPNLYREGYVLEGWYTDVNNTNRFDFENDSVTSHMTLYANWVPIKPVVTFNVGDGSKVDSQTLAYNSMVTKPKNPTLSGYIFDGWFVDEEYTEQFDFTTTVIKDITLYGKWTRIEFTVTFVTNGGTPVADTSTSILDGYKIKEPTTVKQYYTLDGWYKDVDLTQKFYFESEITENITLYAKWIPVRSTVILVDADGVSPVYDELGFVISACNTDINSNFTISPPTPYKDGHTFVGWYLNGKPIDLSTYSQFTPRESEYILVAKWSINSYDIVYTIDGAEYKTTTYKFGDKIKYPEVDIEGHTFSGWKCDGYEELPLTMPADDIKVEGILKVNTYTIEYYVEEKLYTRETYAFGEPIVMIDEPHKDGKTFSGWICSTMYHFPSTMPAFDLRVDGSYDQVIYQVNYYIDDVLVKTDNVFKGHGIIPFAPTKEGYTFSGWFVKTSGGTILMPDVMPENNIDAYGTFSINSYTISFDTASGTEVPSITADYGTRITMPEEPTREGYMFAGWDVEIPDTMPAEDVTITAKWKINQYTITFDTDGGNEVPSITADYGTRITMPEEPTREGYTFAGWDVEIPDTMPAKDMLITAKWDLIEFTIDYDISNMVTDDNQDVIGKVEMVNAVSGKNVMVLSYKITQLNTAKSSTYTEYYNFYGWFTEDGMRVTNEQGELLENVPGYIENGKWIYKGTGETEQVIKIYGRFKQTDSGKYVYDFNSLKTIKDNPSGTYIIVDDIDLIDVIWEPFETFSGTIDGKGHTISNLKINVDTDMTDHRTYGFINSISGTGTIKNLTIKDAKYTVSTINSSFVKDTRYTILGTFAGEILENGKIENCEAINPELNCYARSDHGPDCQWKFVFVGGIAGYSAGSINNCTVSSGKLYGWGAVKFDGQFVEVAVGGVVGYLKAGVVTNCKVKDVTIESKGCSWGEWLNRAYDAYANAGGLAGLMKESNVTDYQTGNVVTGGSRDATVDIAYSASKGYKREGEYIASTEIKNHNYK